MDNATHHSPEVREGVTGPAFVSLARETRAAVDTETAAFHLNRKAQTLRAWACKENGPLRPLRVHGRLAWNVSQLKKLVGLDG